MIRITILLFFFSFSSAAQDSATITGKVFDERTNTPLSGASVLVQRKFSGAFVTSVVCDSTGRFSFKASRSLGYIDIIYSMPGFKTETWSLSGVGEMNLGITRLEPKVRQLKEVEIESSALPVAIRGDTLEFSAAFFKTQPNAVLKDLLMKLPGISIDQYGAITAYGKKITRIMIEGREFFANQTGLALNNLPADLFEKVQVMDTRTRQEAKLQIEKSGDDKTINLVLKKQRRKARFGHLGAGYGTGKRYDASSMLSLLNVPRQITLLGSSNNINNSGTDPDGAASSPATAGVLQLTTVGLNVVDDLSKRIKLNSSYTYNWGELPVFTQANRHRLIDDYRLRVANEQHTFSQGHRMNVGADVEMDSLTELSVKFLVNSDRSNSRKNTEELTINPDGMAVRESQIQEQIRSRRHTFLAMASLTRRLNRRGRSIALNVSASRASHIRDGEQLFDLTFMDVPRHFKRSLEQQLNIEESNSSYTMKATWVEPLSSTTKLTFNYTIDYNSMLSTRLVNTITPTGVLVYVELDSMLSNKFRSTTIVHQPQVLLNYTSKRKTLRASMSGSLFLNSIDNFSYFNGKSNRYNQINAAPNSRIIYRLRNQGELSLLYNGNLRQPDVEQLQPLMVNSSPAQLIVGNPNLRPSFFHSFRLTYQRFSRQGDGINTSLEWAPITNGFSIQTRILDGGVQESKAINVNGNYSYHARVDYNWKLKNECACWKFKTGLVLNGSKVSSAAILANSGADSVPRVNVARMLTLAPSVSVSHQPSDRLEINLNFAPGFSRMAFHSFSNTRYLEYYRHRVSLSGVYRYRSQIYFESELQHTFNGLNSPGFQKGALLWNTAIGYEFLSSKRMTLKVSAYDLLNQNQSVRRNLSDYFVEDFRSNVLQRYFMLSLIYRVKAAKG